MRSLITLVVKVRTLKIAVKRSIDPNHLHTTNNSSTFIDRTYLMQTRKQEKIITFLIERGKVVSIDKQQSSNILLST